MSTTTTIHICTSLQQDKARFDSRTLYITKRLISVADGFTKPLGLTDSNLRANQRGGGDVEN
jgi:hypothetical protein